MQIFRSPKTFILILLIGLSAAVFLFFRFAGDSPQPEGNQLPPQSNAHQMQRYESISKNPLNIETSLHTATKGESKSQITPPENQLPKINLTLIGTGRKNKDTPFAVIQDEPSGDQRLCYKGDIFHNVSIIDILPDRVKVRSGSRTTFLILDRSQNVSTEDLPARKELKLDHPIGVESKFYSDVQEIEKMMAQIALRPHVENDRPAGVVVMDIQPNSLFAKAGLQKDDIITAVDLKEIATMDDAMEIYESVRSSSEGSFQILRNDDVLILHYKNSNTEIPEDTLPQKAK